jgi:hypothetical protein
MGTQVEADRIVRPAAITVRTVEGSVIQGKVNLGSERRVSDIFTGSDKPFVVLFDAAYSGGSGKVFIINKAHIVWIEPEDEELAGVSMEST